MPLHDGYQVGIGRFVEFSSDPDVDFGDFFHGHIKIRVPKDGQEVEFNSAIDLNSPNGGIEYFFATNLDQSKFTTISSLPNGIHRLANNSTSGALDYKRSELISAPLGCVTVWLVFLEWLTGRRQPRGTTPWTLNSGLRARDQLRSMFSSPEDIERIYLFGEPYTYGGEGVHNVHCNQGDPLPDRSDPEYDRKMAWYRENGIWQDGAVIVKYRSDNRLAGFFVKFLMQTLNTDVNGHPIT